GWANYYCMTQYPAQLRKIEAHVRRRLRARIVDQHRKRRSLVMKLMKHGTPRRLATKQVYTNRRRWALSHTRSVEMAFSNGWFAQKGLRIMSDKALPHWFEIGRWIKLT